MRCSIIYKLALLVLLVNKLGYELAGTCSTQGGKINAYKIGSLDGKDHLKDKGRNNMDIGIKKSRLLF